MKSQKRGRCSIVFGMGVAVVLGVLSLPAGAQTKYGWAGQTSSDWGTPSNWQSANMAPTGAASTVDATLYITNKTNNRLEYTAACGYTVYITGSLGSSRCLRIADGMNGTLAITGGTLETRPANGDLLSNGAGNGLLLVDGGTYISTNASGAVFCLGAYNSVPTLTVSNGLARLDNIKIWCSSGTVNLVNGTLGFWAMSLNDSTCMASMNLYGGTLQGWRSTATGSSWMYPNTNWVCRLLGPVTFDTMANTISNTASINGPGSITKIGSGTLILNVSNTVGAITVNEGTLVLGGSNTVSSGITLNGGTLAVNHAAALGSQPLSIYGGRLDNSSGAAVVNVLNTPIYLYTNVFAFVGTRDLNFGAGAVSISCNTVFSNGVKTLTLGGPVSDGGGTNAITATGAGGLVLLGSVSVGGRVVVYSGGSLTLAGANTYTGATAVSDSVLVAANNQALGTTNASTIASGAGAVILSNNVTITDETIFIAGNGDNNRGGLEAASGSTCTWNGVVLLNDSGTWVPRVGYKGNGVLNINGSIRTALTGSDNAYISGDIGSGRVVLNSTNSTYKGITGIIRGTLALGANDALPVGTVLDLHPASAPDWSAFDLAGFSQTVGALKDTSATSGARTVTNSSDTVSVLTVNQTITTIYAGRIDGNVSLVKTGSGSLTLAGTNNAYTGATVLSGGTLALAADGALSPYAPLTLEGGTLSVGATRTTVLQLTVSGDVTIDLGDGTGVLTVGDSSAQVWSGTLNFTGTFVPSSIRFGTDGAGLTQDQLDIIRINGLRRWLTLDANGILYVRTGTVIGIR